MGRGKRPRVQACWLNNWAPRPFLFVRNPKVGSGVERVKRQISQFENTTVSPAGVVSGYPWSVMRRSVQRTW